MRVVTMMGEFIISILLLAIVISLTIANTLWQNENREKKMASSKDAKNKEKTNKDK